MQSVPLLEAESSRLVLSLPSISTLTVYRDARALDVDSAETHFRARVDAIVHFNPWLCGHLVAAPRTRRVHLQWGPPYRKKTVFARRALDLGRFDTDAEIKDAFACISAARDVVVPRGTHALDNPSAALFRVTFIDIPDPTTTTTRRFALFFSVSHVIADGHTFYELYGMLSAYTPPRALHVTRVDICRAPPALFQSPWFRANMARTALFGGAPTLAVRYFDTRKIAHEVKHVFTSSSQRVSANDVVTAALFSAFRLARGDVGMMAINLRGRGTGLTSIQAGNYESVLVFDGGAARPEDIRRCLLTQEGTAPPPPPPPPSTTSMWSTTCLVTSWASLYRHVHLPPDVDATHELHLPFCLPDASMKTRDTAVLFRPQENELAVLLLTRTLTPKDVDESSLRDLI